MAINYKCPGCGDAMVFKEGTDNLVCESCGTEIEVQEFLKDREDAKDEIITDNNKEDTYKVIKCSTCGATSANIYLQLICNQPLCLQLTRSTP